MSSLGEMGDETLDVNEDYPRAVSADETTIHQAAVQILIPTP